MSLTAVMVRRLRQAAKLLLLVRRPLWRHGLRHRVAAAVEHRGALRSLDPVPQLVVDIGANKGQFALLAAELFPAARIEAFEPLAAPAACFEALFHTIPRVRLHSQAVGPEAAAAMMYVTGRDDSSSLLPPTPLQSTTFPGTETVGEEQVRVSPLATALPETDLPRPALLKLDVQGFELEALKGCATLLDAFDHLYVECSFLAFYAGQPLAAEVIAWLSANNFYLVGIYNPTYDQQGRALQADLLFRQQAAL